MNKLLCCLACTWITIIDSPFYIIEFISRCFIVLKCYFGCCLVVKIPKSHVLAEEHVDQCHSN